MGVFTLLSFLFNKSIDTLVSWFPQQANKCWEQPIYFLVSKSMYNIPSTAKCQIKIHIEWDVSFILHQLQTLSQ